MPEMTEQERQQYELARREGEARFGSLSKGEKCEHKRVRSDGLCLDCWCPAKGVGDA